MLNIFKFDWDQVQLVDRSFTVLAAMFGIITSAQGEKGVDSLTYNLTVEKSTLQVH